MKIVVAGSRGTLGSAVMKYWNSPAVREKCPSAAGLPIDEIVPLDLPESDISSRRFTLDTVAEIKPDIILNATGVNLIDWLETHPNTARTIHVQGTVCLRDAAKRTGALLVQVGCGEIFYSANSDEPADAPGKTESDEPNPESVYAKTKLDAERAATEYERHLIVRTATLFGDPGTQSSGNLVDSFLKSCLRARTLRVIGDLRTSPTYVLDLVRALFSLVHGGATGRYHVVNGGSAAPSEIASELLRLCGLSRHEVVPIPLAEYGTAAPHSLRTVLDSARYRALFGVYPLPDWRTALAEYVARRQAAD